MLWLTLETPKKQQFNTMRNTMVSCNQQQWKQKCPTTITIFMCLTFIFYVTHEYFWIHKAKCNF